MPELIANPFIDGRAPDWASGYGQDKFGFYAEWSVDTGDAYWDSVTQRMRWIPVGNFQMGSPEDEAERKGRETQHEVTFSCGFWLADTACTQVLWNSVMHDNPSHFKGGQRPVERVVYDDALGFCDRVNAKLPELELGLPNEAQWEYACRAGTTTPFHTGKQITTDQANYNGNYPYPGGTKGEYRRQTIDVKALEPNPWGLYQMHGNVWEWCLDWYGDYPAEPQVAPFGPEDSSDRVVRGGSWSLNAGYLRSAFRVSWRPGFRSGNLGFRCVSSASPAQKPSK